MIKDTCLFPNAAQCYQNLGLEVPRTAPERYRLIVRTTDKQHKANTKNNIYQTSSKHFKNTMIG